MLIYATIVTLGITLRLAQAITLIESFGRVELFPTLGSQLFFLRQSDKGLYRFYFAVGGFIFWFNLHLWSLLLCLFPSSFTCLILFVLLFQIIVCYRSIVLRSEDSVILLNDKRK